MTVSGRAQGMGQRLTKPMEQVTDRGLHRLHLASLSSVEMASSKGNRCFHWFLLLHRCGSVPIDINMAEIFLAIGAALEGPAGLEIQL